MKKSDAMISIIIPAYNQAIYLGETIRCVLRQTIRDFELIVVDDGSTDQTSEVVQTFTDPRIKYIHQANGGLSAARNTGIGASSAPHLIFLDADDLLLPDALANHLDNIRTETDFGLSVGGWQYIDSKSKLISDSLFPPADLSSFTLLDGNPFPVHSVMLNRKWLYQIDWFDENLRACEDWDIWLRVASLGASVIPFDQVVCQYRMHEGQMTRQADRMRTAMLAVLDKLFSSQQIPSDWQAARDNAYAAAYFKAAARLYHVGDFSTAKADLAKAVALDSSFLADEAQKLIEQLTGWANAPMADNPLTYLEQVFDNLPDELSQLRRYRESVLAKFAMDLAFQAHYQGNRPDSRSFVWRAFRYQPNWLKNKWALSILVKSYTR